ncbi:MAG: peptidoglycan-binding protein LysM [Gemmobacter sp.]
MGVWGFIKDAGKSLFGSKAEAGTLPDDPAAAADRLRAEVDALGLETEGLTISVTGDKVTVSGDASAEVKEKVILAVGNVEGVAEVEAETVEAPLFHTVAKGDTLSAIAKAHLGNANRYAEIFEANKPMLTHPDKIYPGQMLRIPRG